MEGKGRVTNYKISQELSSHSCSGSSWEIQGERKGRTVKAGRGDKIQVLEDEDIMNSSRVGTTLHLSKTRRHGPSPKLPPQICRHSLDRMDGQFALFIKTKKKKRTLNCRVASSCLSHPPDLIN